MKIDKSERPPSTVGGAGQPDDEKPEAARRREVKRGAAKQPCTATVVDRHTGARRPCRSWAMRGSEPPLCYVHAVRAGALKHRRHLQVGRASTPGQSGRQPPSPSGEPPVTGLALYRPFYDDAETAALLALADPTSLEGEIATVRVIVRRLLAYMTRQNDAPAGVLLRFSDMIFKGAWAVAHLVRDQTAAGEEAAVHGAIEQALDELAKEWGLDDLG